MAVEFFTADGREVKFIAAEFPGDEGFVLAGAERCSKKTATYFDDIELVRGLHSGRYWAFKVHVAGELVGGVVLEIIRKRHSGDEQIDVWLLWGGRIREWLAPALQALERLRSDTGCDGVRFTSPRMGWLKLLPRGRLHWVMEI